MPELLSNCCSASPMNEEMVIAELCPKCLCHCEYEEVETNEEIAAEILSERQRETINKYK